MPPAPPASPVPPAPPATPPRRDTRTATAPSARTREPLSPEAQAARRARAERETSAGGIVYRVHDGEALFLLIRDCYRNWGFPKGHLEDGRAARRCGAARGAGGDRARASSSSRGAIETIDWFFRFRGKLVHKVCHFYLMRTDHARTVPQREEGITACRWASFDEADAADLVRERPRRAPRAHAMLHVRRRVRRRGRELSA